MTSFAQPFSHPFSNDFEPSYWSYHDTVRKSNSNHFVLDQERKHAKFRAIITKLSAARTIFDLASRAVLLAKFTTKLHGLGTDWEAEIAKR